MVMREVIDLVSRYAKCSRVTGLNLNSEIKKRLWFWKELRDAPLDLGKIESVWPKEAIEFFEVVKPRDYPEYPLFFANSCALAYVLGIPNFSGFYDSNVCHRNHCPANQRRICRTALEGYAPDRERVEIELKKLGLSGEAVVDSEKRAVIVNEPIEHGRLVYLTHVLNYKIISPDVRSDHEWGGLVIGREGLVFTSGQLSS